MDKNKQKIFKRTLRHNRLRSKISGSMDRPRLSVFRSLKNISAQLIDDATGKTLAFASSTEIKTKGNKQNLSAEVGKLIAKKALEKGMSAVVFDRGGFRYHGRVKALADAAREGGLKF